MIDCWFSFGHFADHKRLEIKNFLRGLCCLHPHTCSIRHTRPDLDYSTDTINIFLYWTVVAPTANVLRHFYGCRSSGRGQTMNRLTARMWLLYLCSHIWHFYITCVGLALQLLLWLIKINIYPLHIILIINRWCCPVGELKHNSLRASFPHQ